jgi:hypothetical protein
MFDSLGEARPGGGGPGDPRLMDGGPSDPMAQGAPFFGPSRPPVLPLSGDCLAETVELEGLRSV